jgi:thiol peroxidase
MANLTIQGRPIHTNGELPKLGSHCPNFLLIDKDLTEVTLQKVQGKRALLSFVPSLDTAVCSLSAKKFNEKVQSHPEVAILVISCDLPFAQKRTCSSEQNIMTLSMMRDKRCASDYGILIEDGPLAGLCARAVVVIDEEGKVVYTELVPDIVQEPNYDEALAVLLAKTRASA